jgi:hypothetical protein
MSEPIIETVNTISPEVSNYYEYEGIGKLGVNTLFGMYRRGANLDNVVGNSNELNIQKNLTEKINDYSSILNQSWQKRYQFDDIGNDYINDITNYYKKFKVKPSSVDLLGKLSENYKNQDINYNKNLTGSRDITNEFGLQTNLKNATILHHDVSRVVLGGEEMPNEELNNENLHNDILSKVSNILKRPGISWLKDKVWSMWGSGDLSPENIQKSFNFGSSIEKGRKVIKFIRDLSLVGIGGASVASLIGLKSKKDIKNQKK